MTNIPLMWTPLVQRQIHKPRNVYSYTLTTCACSGCWSHLFFFPWHNTHRQENTYTYWTHTHILRNSSYSSCSGVPSLVMSSYVWSFLLGALLLQEKKQQNWANVCLCPPWEGRAFLLPKYKSQDFGCILSGQREAMAERKIPIRHWSEPN